MTKEANMLLYQCKSHRSLLSLPGGEKRGHSSKSEAAESQEDIKFDSLCKPLSKSVLQGLPAWQIQLTASFGKLTFGINRELQYLITSESREALLLHVLVQKE